ncbi:hypothetical protein PAXRUDRAFT_331311 [Paxillus rubicundulus Ve08.2h10]|uniref:Uncharacterized protein n=1 Tax=Paxillus rubicundulus Ve08.2h10 TaxID=930991 RepID=A0A0D0DXA5_9AGAM|nr:hypothetical protein PAXRUDRAFT_331311 [Paxillus rubicundulus Ve08.2h10]
MKLAIPLRHFCANGGSCSWAVVPTRSTIPNTIRQKSGGCNDEAEVSHITKSEVGIRVVYEYYAPMCVHVHHVDVDTGVDLE